MSPAPRCLLVIAAIAALASSPIILAPTTLSAQSLRGSMESVDRMYDHARTEGLSFYETPSEVQSAAKEGRLVRLESSGTLQLHSVRYPYVRPSTRMFVERLATQYRSECGEALVVTSGVRPATRQPRNSIGELSVHPTGMAIDLRKPRKPKCLRWLRSALLDLEGGNVLEATEEHRPAHFHVAVFPAEYTRYASAKAKSDPEAHVVLASHGIAGGTKYRVREGDTLWDIARTHATTVDAILGANDLEGDVIKPGQELRIPATR
jgi:LysM repeat protein